jgi:hypothetical protein
VHPLGRFGRTSFKLPTEVHSSSTKNRGFGASFGPTAPVSRWPAVADVRDRDHSLSFSFGYKNPCQWKVSPLHHFFLPAEVSSVISLLPPSCRTTGPFFDSFGGFTPHTCVLLLPQFAQSSGNDLGLHHTCHRRPPLNAGELLLLCSPPPRRHNLMSVAVLCSSGPTWELLHRPNPRFHLQHRQPSST